MAPPRIIPNDSDESKKDGLQLVELADGVTFDELQEKTGAPIKQ